MADIPIPIAEYVSIQDAMPHVGMNPKKATESVGVLDGTGIVITLREERGPMLPVIPRTSTMYFNPSEQEGIE